MATVSIKLITVKVENDGDNNKDVINNTFVCKALSHLLFHLILSINFEVGTSIKF